MEIHEDKPRRAFATALWQAALERVWYVHPPVVLVIQATRLMCLQTLALAAKPSTQRLHLRNLFASGRRYEMQPRPTGFALMTTNKVIWRYRRRTTPSAVLNADFAENEANSTRIQMRVRIRLLYLADAFVLPTFMASILVFVPWHPFGIVVFISVLYLLSWFGHRYNAALEANEMVFFVQKALEDLVAVEILALAAETPGIVYDSDFNVEWEKFYEEHKDQ